MRRPLAAILLACTAAAIATAGCSTVASPPDVPARLDALVSGLHARGLFDGAVVVGTSDAIVWQKGFGQANREAAAPFTPATAADGASLAKTFTAALLILLDREGTLDLDAPARRFLPELPYDAITLRHLLSHSSGLPVVDYGFFDDLLPAGQPRTTEMLLAALGKAKPPLASAPGTRFEYNSLGFDLAALAAARAAKTPLDRLLDERLFRPAGMSSAFLRPGRLSDFPGVRTRGYRHVNGAIEPHDSFDLEGFHGGSNIFVSALDLHRWNTSFLRGSPLDGDALRDALQPARIGDAPSGLTLGSWYRDAEGTAFWYSGHLEGFHSVAFRHTGLRRSIVYTSNNTLDPWLQHGLVRAISAILDGREPEPLDPPAVGDVLKEDRPRLAGRWTLPDGDVVEVTAVGETLAMRSDGVSYQMFQVTPGAFYVPGQDFMVGFAATPGRPIARMFVSSNLWARWAQRTDASR